MNNWINIKDQKPEQKQRVLVHATGGRMLTAVYWPFLIKHFYCYDIRSEELERVESVTHWMPLPELPLFTNLNL